MLELDNRVVELLETIHSEEATHSHAVVNQQLYKADAVHHQSIQHGLFQGTHLGTAHEIITICMITQ